MTYKESIDFLFSQLPMFSRVGAPAYKPGLDTVRRLDEYMNHPHQHYPTIHIAGTNGKGSSSHLIAAALQAQGFKVGLYTSPHLVDFRERIRVNGTMISEEGVTAFVERWRVNDYDARPSFFELTMMMAFEWFAIQKVDIAVIEVGMGGRLDSTNIITPLVSLITNISEDHKQFLGNTLEQIAAEKAGIIKRGVPVVVSERQADGIHEVFERVAREVGTSITTASDTEDITLHHEADGWRISFPGGSQCKCPLSGDYQAANIRGAWCALRVLADNSNFKVSEEAVSAGFAGVCTLTGLMGRWMTVHSYPAVICDTGHNLAGITYNMNQLRSWQQKHPQSTLRLVIGFVADKDVEHILPLFPRDAAYYFTQASIPRALPVEKLSGMAGGAGLDGNSYSTVSDAYAAAMEDSSADDLIFVGGSTFVVADLLLHLTPTA